MATTSSRTAEVTLPSDTQIQITREFDAPRHLVYRAYTTPELIRRWWAGNRGEMTIVDVDLRVGGQWRYVMTANGGFEVAFHGEYRAIVANERLVMTAAFEGMPEAQAAIDTVTFGEAGARTLLTQLTQFANEGDRDAVLNSGMEGGMQEAMDQLEQVARSLR